MNPGHLIDASAIAKLADFEVDSKNDQSSTINILDFAPIVLSYANSSTKFNWREIFGHVTSGRRFNFKSHAVQTVKEEDYGLIGHQRLHKKQANLHRLSNAVYGDQVWEWEACH